MKMNIQTLVKEYNKQEQLNNKIKVFVRDRIAEFKEIKILIDQKKLETDLNYVAYCLLKQAGLENKFKSGQTRTKYDATIFLTDEEVLIRAYQQRYKHSLTMKEINEGYCREIEGFEKLSRTIKKIYKIINEQEKTLKKTYTKLETDSWNKLVEKDKELILYKEKPTNLHSYQDDWEKGVILKKVIKLEVELTRKHDNLNSLSIKINFYYKGGTFNNNEFSFKNDIYNKHLSLLTKVKKHIDKELRLKTRYEKRIQTVMNKGGYTNYLVLRDL